MSQASAVAARRAKRWRRARKKRSRFARLTGWLVVLSIFRSSHHVTRSKRRASRENVLPEVEKRVRIGTENPLAKCLIGSVVVVMRPVGGEDDLRCVGRR